MVNQINKSGAIFDVAPILTSSLDEFINHYKETMLIHGICTEENVIDLLTDVYNEAQQFKEVVSEVKETAKKSANK